MFKSMFEDISPTTEYIRIDVRNKFINEFNLTDRDVSMDFIKSFRRIYSK